MKCETHWPWFLNFGLVNVFHAPFLHFDWAFTRGVTTFWSVPLTVMAETSAVPWTSMRMSIEPIAPVGNGTWFPAAASVAAVKVYVAVPSALIVGVTLLHPRK